MSLSKVGRRSLQLLGDGVREERERDHNRFPATEMGMILGGTGSGEEEGRVREGGREERKRGKRSAISLLEDACWIWGLGYCS